MNSNLINNIKYFSECKSKSNTVELFKKLRKEIEKKFIDNSFIKKSKIEDEFFEQNGVKFLFKKIIKNRISEKNKVSTINKQIQDKIEDPFDEPFEEGSIITEDFCGLNHHRLFVNKYPILDYHLILATKEFKSQYEHLDKDDFKGIIMLNAIMNGITYFNAGEKAGASQLRKHVQTIPLSSLFDGSFGIFDLIDKEDNNLIVLAEEESFKICLIKIFYENNIKHSLIKFNKVLSEKLKAPDIDELSNISNVILAVYKNSLNNLSLLNKEEEENKIEKDYSFLMNDKWMLIVPRKSNYVNLKNGKLNLNSASFTLSLLVGSEELLAEMKSLNIINEIYLNL